MSALPLDLSPIADALNGVETAITAAAGSTCIDWIQLAATIAVMFFTGWAALAASRSARATKQSTDYEHLRDLRAQYDQMDYMVRFWRLDQLSRDLPLGSVSVHAVPLKHPDPEATPGQYTIEKRLWDEALARDWSSPRHDLHGFYYFALRLNAWLTRAPKGRIRNEDVSYMNDVFGPYLVGTLLNHQTIACRLRHRRKSPDYYPRAYGLFDAKYRNLVRLLLNDLVARGLTQTEFASDYEDRLAEIDRFIGSVGSETPEANGVANPGVNQTAPCEVDSGSDRA